MSTKGAHLLHLACQGGGLTPVSYATSLDLQYLWKMVGFYVIALYKMLLR